MPARLLISARLIGILILLFSILLILARWKYPQNQDNSVSFWELWKDTLRRWRISRAREKERAINMRSLRKKRILLVDPDERSVRVLTWRLKSLGCQVSNSRNGIHALSIASSGSYDVIMVDALLPDVSAVDFFNLLSSPRPAIVFLGVLNTQRDQIMGLGARVGCLGKPFDPEDALALAGRLLREGGFAPALN